MWENVRYLKKGLTKLDFPATESATQIIPIIVGEAAQAVAKSKRLYKRGILCPAIRPPTVPKGSSRLRILLMSEHEKEDLDRLLSML